MGKALKVFPDSKGGLHVNFYAFVDYEMHSHPSDQGFQESFVRSSLCGNNNMSSFSNWQSFEEEEEEEEDYPSAEVSIL